MYISGGWAMVMMGYGDDGGIVVVPYISSI